jgi:hypothetical protein
VRGSTQGGTIVRRRGQGHSSSPQPAFTFRVGPVDKFKVSCAEEDRLNMEWRGAVNRFADAVKSLQSVDDRKFHEQFEEQLKASRAAGECVTNARQALELHRTNHQCGLSEKAD